MAHAPTPHELTRRETELRNALTHAEAKARSRLEQICDKLQLPAPVARGILLAGLEVAREFAAETNYANYQHRTGTHWPVEWRDLDEEEWEAAWRLVLEVVDAGAARATRGEHRISAPATAPRP